MTLCQPLPIYPQWTLNSLNKIQGFEGHDGAELVVEERDCLLPVLVFGSELGFLDDVVSSVEVAAW